MIIIKGYFGEENINHLDTIMDGGGDFIPCDSYESTLIAYVEGIGGSEIEINNNLNNIGITANDINKIVFKKVFLKDEQNLTKEELELFKDILKVGTTGRVTIDNITFKNGNIRIYKIPKECYLKDINILNEKSKYIYFIQERDCDIILESW